MTHGSYTVAIRYKEQLLNQTVTGIVVAVGLSLWPTEKRGEFGYTQLPGVVTSLDLEIILQQSRSIGSGTAGGFRPVCWFTRFCPGVPYCFSGMLFYVPRLANLLQSSHTGSEVDIFYLDRQHYESIYSASPPSCRYIRAMPGKVTTAPESQLQVALCRPLDRKAG